MKANAELCSAYSWHDTYSRLGGSQPPLWAPEGIAGGARSFVRALLGVLDQMPRDRSIELHAVGHSAGAIYHAHFLPMLLEELARRGPRLRDPGVASLQLLAPALRIDDFEELLAPHLAGAIKRLAIYTMDDKRERDDNASIYQKSLLYLVNEAFERESEPGLLGLQRSLEPRIAQVGTATAKAFAQQKVTRHYSNGKNSAYTIASSHGDFDNDPLTMTSVATLVGAPPTTATRYGSWIKKRPKRRPYKRSIDLDDGELRGQSDGPTAAGTRNVSGQRRALCIGIDAYPPGATLAGCVNDARQWGTTLQSLSFQVSYLLDVAASRAGLLAALEQQVSSSVSGDWLVVQFAGHGTQLEDLDGDETSGFDQAFVPHDYREQGCLLDDELYGLLQPAAARGVQISLFFDTCHSGSASRFAPMEGLPRGGDRRARYLPATAQMNLLQRQVSPVRALHAMRSSEDGRVPWLHLAACKDDEYAFETAGSGDFTRATAPLLSRAQAQGWTGAELLRELRQTFPAGSRQTPQLMAAVDPSRAVLPTKAEPGGAVPSDARQLVAALESALAAAKRMSGLNGQ